MENNHKQQIEVISQAYGISPDIISKAIDYVENKHKIIPGHLQIAMSIVAPTAGIEADFAKVLSWATTAIYGYYQFNQSDSELAGKTLKNTLLTLQLVRGNPESNKLLMETLAIDESYGASDIFDVIGENYYRCSGEAQAILSKLLSGTKEQPDYEPRVMDVLFYYHSQSLNHYNEIQEFIKEIA